MKKRRMNMTPYNVRVRTHSKGFSLIFTDDKKEFCLHFDFWWTVYLAKELWKVITFQRDEVDMQARIMKNEK